MKKGDSLIIRSNIRQNFTVIPNEMANDDRLPADALGLLVYLLTKPNDWKVRVNELRSRFDMGKDKTYRILGNLEQLGYVIRESVRSGGQFAETRYIVRDLPCSDFSDAAKPDAAEPDAVFQTHTKNIKNKEPKITKSTNKKPVDDLVLTDKLIAYASDYGLDAKEVMEDVRLWDMMNGKKARYASLEAFFMQWVRREAKKIKRKPQAIEPAIKPARELTEKQKEFAHASLAKLWDREKLGDQGFSFQSLLDDVHAFMMTNQTDQDWEKIGNGIKRPF